METKQPNLDLSSWQQPLVLADFKEYYKADQVAFFLRRWAIITLLALLLLVLAWVEIFAWPFLTGANNGVAVLEGAPWWLGLCPYLIALWSMTGAIFYLHSLQHHVRFWRFCRANDLTYRGRVINRHWEGAPFLCPSGYDGTTSPCISGKLGGESFDFGRYILTDDGSDSKDMKIIRPFVFGHSRLPRKMPHIIVKNKASRIIPLIGAVRQNAYVKPEGDFQEHFTIICPKHYEQDALTIFTPEVLEEVYSFASDAEIELVDDELFVYTRHLSTFHHPEKFLKLCEIMLQLDARLDKRAGRYRDSFASLDKLALGRRLHLSQTSLLSIIWSTVIALIVLFQILRLFNIGPFNDWIIKLVQMFE